VVPALTPHICIDELQAIAPLPVIDITRVVAARLRERRLSKVALFGTRYVVQSDLFGRLDQVDVVRPRAAEIAFVHTVYSQLAHTGTVSGEQRQQLVALAHTLQARDGVEAIVLAGTDFAVTFDPSNTPFPHLDCARAHIDAVLQAAGSDAGNVAPTAERAS
jgi:aspartate racemase